MASRREQKEALRGEREQREAAAKGGERRKQLLGYAAGLAVVLIAIVAAIALLSGGDEGSGATDVAADVLPDGGSFPEPDSAASVEVAAKAAGCELKSYPSESRSPHITDINEPKVYPSKPPTSGRHYAEWTEDKAFEVAPDVKMLVHTLEHGRVVIWFKKSLTRERRASLKAYYDSDDYQLVLTPDETGMRYEVAASAWNRDPKPNGTGRLLGCPKYDDTVFTALEAFKDEHRGRGPEPVP